jgi:hypothetical protein
MYLRVVRVHASMAQSPGFNPQHCKKKKKSDSTAEKHREAMSTHRKVGNRFHVQPWLCSIVGWGELKPEPQSMTGILSDNKLAVLATGEIHGSCKS